MKKRSLIAVLVVLIAGATLSAKDFDWSECWCNYGGGIKEGDFLLTVSGGVDYSDLNAYGAYDGFWYLPPVMVEFQYAMPIWKLPFTFGGYAGIRGYGFSYDVWNQEKNKHETKNTSYWGTFFGGEATYHMQLPPKELDLYATTRVGANIPIVKPSEYWKPDYFQFGSACGANWFFSNGFGLNLEFGYPFSKIGVTFKF